VVKKEFVGTVNDTGEIVSKNIYDKFTINKEQNPTNQITEEQFSLQKSYNLIQPPYPPEHLAKLLEINTFHYRCTHTKAQDVAGNGYEIKKVEENANEDNKQLIKEFINRQFPTIEEILTKVEIDYNSIGYGALELVKEGNMHNTVYRYMNHIPAHTIRVLKDNDRYVQKRGTNYRYFKSPTLEKDVNKHNGEISELGELNEEDRASDLIMLKDYSPRSDYYGIPGIVTALNAIWGNLAQQQYNSEFFKNHGIPQYAVYITGDYNLEQDDEGNYTVIESIKEHLSKVRQNPHSSLVFGIPSNTSGMGDTVQVEFEKLAVETKDASFRMYRKDNRDEIVVNHGVPGSRIGLSEAGSLGGDGAYETNRVYKESTINPRQRELEEYINTYITRSNFNIDGWRFKLKTIDIDSKEKDKEMLGFLFDNGAATPNDLIRNLGEDYGIEPDENDPALSSHYIQGQPIDMLGMGMSQQEIDTTLNSIKSKLEMEK